MFFGSHSIIFETLFVFARKITFRFSPRALFDLPDLPYCPVIMGDNIICWRLDGDKPGVWNVHWWNKQPLLDRALLDQPLWDHPLLDQPLLDRATRPVAPTFVW